MLKRMRGDEALSTLLNLFGMHLVSKMIADDSMNL
jgi:hypothetical protein